jgi:hypothetical protein
MPDFRQWLNIFGYCVFMATNAISGTTVAKDWGLATVDIGEQSHLANTAVTPANYAFSIWGLIYFMTGGFVVVQALPSRRAWTEQKVGFWWAANTIIGEGMWPFAW